MFYDLESPLDFMRQIHDPGGRGHLVFEQSYMPTMLRQIRTTRSAEHLVYRLGPIKWMTDRADSRSLTSSSTRLTAQHRDWVAKRENGAFPNARQNRR